MQERNNLSLYLAEGLQLTATCGTNHSVFTNPLYKKQSAGFQGHPRLLSSSLPCSCVNCVRLLSESCPFSLQMASSEAALLCMLTSTWLDSICQWSVALDSYMMFTHVFLKIKKNHEASTSHDVPFNSSHIHSPSSLVDFCLASVREPVSWPFTYFSICNADISTARFRLPSEEQVQALGSLLL